ncbi:MAG TPA: hypothetical protein VIM51_03055 [Desulfosporosinus sp.]
MPDRIYFERFGFFVLFWVISAILGGTEGKTWKVLLAVDYVGICKNPFTSGDVMWGYCEGCAGSF